MIPLASFTSHSWYAYSTWYGMVCVPLSRVRHILLKRQHASLDTVSRGIRRVGRQYRRGVSHDELNILQQFHLHYYYVHACDNQRSVHSVTHISLLLDDLFTLMTKTERESRRSNNTCYRILIDTTPFSFDRCFLGDRNNGVCTIGRSWGQKTPQIHLRTPITLRRGACTPLFIASPRSPVSRKNIIIYKFPIKRGRP